MKAIALAVFAVKRLREIARHEDDEIPYLGNERDAWVSLARCTGPVWSG